jgi:hypothetical protein
MDGQIHDGVTDALQRLKRAAERSIAAVNT